MSAELAGHSTINQHTPHSVSLAGAVFQSPDAIATPCSLCDGAGWYLHRVPLGHDDFGRLIACPCQEPTRQARHTASLAAMSNLEAFHEKTFATFDALVPGVQESYREARRYAAQPQGWLTLLGPYGCGKTHLAAAIANTLLQAGMPLLFAVVPDLLDQLRSAYSTDNPDSFDQTFQRIRNAPFLVLDDLGTESLTAWAREKLYQIVNHRYNLHLPTLMTSNLRLECVDGRIVSRMHDKVTPAKIIEIHAADYRKQL